MNELQQLKEVIGDKRTSIDKLEELRSMAEAQLDSYARAIGLLERRPGRLDIRRLARGPQRWRRRRITGSHLVHLQS